MVNTYTPNRMPATNLKKSSAKFIGAITSLKKKPTRQKASLPVKPLYSIVYQFSKDKVFGYFSWAGGYALRNVSKIMRIGYNYCVPHAKLMTEEELRLHLMEELGVSSYSDTSRVVRVKMQNNEVFAGDIYATPSQDIFVLRCWRPDPITLNIKYNEVVQIHFMSDGSDYEVI